MEFEIFVRPHSCSVGFLGVLKFGRKKNRQSIETVFRSITAKSSRKKARSLFVFSWQQALS